MTTADLRIDALSSARRNPRGLIVGSIAVLAISALYYATYIDAGFNVADDGNYAQVCYELLLGRPIGDMAVNYGLLWFKLGEGLFRLFGVHYVLVKLLFFGCIGLTNLLLFLTLAQVWGDGARRGASGASIAGAFTAVALIVPAFPATAFYGLCVMVNVAAQVRLAARFGQGHETRDAALAGVALALSAQIRPDFGYIFAFSLAAVLIVAQRADRRRLAGSAVAGFAIGSLPFFLCALVGGYADLLVQQYLDYPRLMIAYGVKGLSGLLPHGADALPATPGGLPRPPLAAMFDADAARRDLAILVYAPLAIVAAFLLMLAPRVPAWWRERRDAIAQIIVALTAALATVPHYLLFRPDAPHVANFMPGFIAMCGILLALLARDVRHRPVLAILSAAVAAHLLFYLWAGMQLPGTGSIAIAQGRDARFQSENGVDVRVSPDEAQLLTRLRDIVAQHSRPGDAIVCLPYCPGYAFMTGRRMLFRNFYVDDRLLTEDPGWLDAAIATTQSIRPPVVIIADWAVNETERSRFPVWGKSYVEAVESLATDRISLPGLTLYILPPANASERQPPN